MINCPSCGRTPKECIEDEFCCVECASRQMAWTPRHSWADEWRKEEKK